MKYIATSVVAMLLLSGCDNTQSNNSSPSETEVGVVTLKSQPVSVVSELTGRTSAALSAEVRPQVGGIIQKRLFKEGDLVKAGQPLYQIDAASYQAAWNEARAALQQAQALVKADCQKAQRYTRLVKENGVSQQDADDAQSTCAQDKASVEAKKAALETARINLDWTTVTAPISGRIGISSVTPGALVTASQDTALTTIRGLDTMYVDLTRSSVDLLRLRKQSLATNSDTMSVSLILEDGTTYSEKGRLELTEVAVDESTGSVTLRAIFPNPQQQLLPGMFVRARVDEGVMEDAILAPQQGVTRDAKGNATALVVNKDNKVEQRTLETGETYGDKWLVLNGLHNGDRLIVEGSAKVTSGRPSRLLKFRLMEQRLMFSRFFVRRPVFAWVIAILIMLAGILAIRTLPVAQYPDVAPPTIKISATYTGASAETLENSVTQVIEQQLTGLDNLLYFSSTSSSDGSVSINVTFEQGTDPDTAQVQVQNKIQQAESRLPSEVQQTGVTVEKSQSNFLLIAAVYDTTDKASSSDIADWLVSNVQDPLARVEGVGSLQVFGAEYAMRIWLDPAKLASYSLMPSDVQSAIEAQNVQVTAGKIGALPSPNTQQLTATVRAQSRLQTVDQFKNIIVKSQSDGAVVRIKDVARVEMGSEDYTAIGKLNGHPSAGVAVMLSPGANALNTATLVKDKIAEFQRNMPQGYDIAYPKDSTEFIKISVEDVIQTLFEAIVLVVCVMYLFLQNLRATLIPALAVPVVLLGTFGVLALFGYSINTLTLFAMVLAIGLLVDDAIVVVENVERIMRDEGLPAREATEKSMGEISGALVAIALVLSAVFLPMAFFGGSTGVIYRQFSITIISAMLLSVVVALTLTPALCGSVLQHVPPHKKGFFGAFNRFYRRTEDKYQRGVIYVLRRAARTMGLYVVLGGGMALMMWKLPGSFLPTEDQGEIMVQYTLPAGATAARTAEVNRQIVDWFLINEKANTDVIFTVDGFSFSGSGQNTGMAFVSLKNWSQRKGAENTAQAIALRATKELGTIRDATVFAMTPPAVDGLGQSNGFTFELLANGGADRETLLQMRNQLIEKANQSPELHSVRANDLPQMPQLQVDIDSNKAVSLGLSLNDVTDTLSSAWGGTYVNDFIDRGRVKKVYIQGDSEFRSAPSDLGKWFVRGSDNAMTPFSAFATTRWLYGPERLVRYNGSAAYEIQGENATGFSSGDAMTKMEELANSLPAGTTWAWSGLSLQEKLASGQALSLYAVSILVVFLCLAALYESWSVPFSVILVIPLGLLGAALAAWMRDLNNDVYFQVALLTTIGLSSKNAILIVEFAEAAVAEGYSLSRAALRAAQTRLRPIIMTSLAFIAGVMPLAIATGAGANSRIAIGTGIIGGTLTATLLAIFFVPLFFVLVKRLFAGKPRRQE